MELEVLDPKTPDPKEYRPENLIATNEDGIAEFVMGTDVNKITLNNAIATEICSRRAKGESLSSICNNHAHLPGPIAVRNWLLAAENGDERFLKFYNAYARANHINNETEFNKITEIADEEPSTALDLAHNNLRITTRKWTLGRRNPKKFGDKILSEHTGANGGAIKMQMVTAQITVNMTEKEAAQAYLHMLKENNG